MVISQQHLSAVLVLALCVAAADAAGGATVEHSLDGGNSFSTAGRIHLQDRVTDADSAAVSGVFERQALSSSTLQQLEQLVEADSLYLWRVRLPDQPPVLTSIKAACLASALPSPQYALQLDAGGRIMSAQISVPAAATQGGSCSTSHALQDLKALPAGALSDLQDVEVSVHTPKPGPAVPRPPAEAAQPDLMAATGAAQQQAQQKQQQQQRRPQQQRPAGKEGDEAADGDAPPPPVDDRSWLQKNWMMVLAGTMMIVNIVTKMLDPQQAQAGAGQARQPGRRPIQ